MDGRQQRGRQLAKDPRIRQVDGPIWYAPSSRKEGGYLVNVEAGRCSCPDGAARCKHLIAVEIVRGGLDKPDDAQVAIVFPAPAKQPRGDLSTEEQEHVRRALRFLRTRSGGMGPLAKALRMHHGALKNVLGRRTASAGLAVRLARFAGVPVDDVIAGRYPPPGACPHCGQVAPTPSP